MEKEIYGIIYLIKNKINNKIYIGQTTQDGGFDRRYHTKDGIKDTHNEHLRNSINKYGIENFYINKEFDIAYSKEELDKCSTCDLCSKANDGLRSASREGHIDTKIKK